MNGGQTTASVYHTWKKDKKEDWKKDKIRDNKNELGLSNEQAAKIKEYNMASQQRMKAIKEDKTLTQDQKKERLMAEQKAKKEFMRNLLTPDQKKKMQEGRMNNNGQRGQNGQNRQRGQNGQRGQREVNSGMNNR